MRTCRNIRRPYFAGENENEALSAAISQFGNIDEIKKELGVEGEAEKLILETVFAYFSPDVLFWRREPLRCCMSQGKIAFVFPENGLRLRQKDFVKKQGGSAEYGRLTLLFLVK